MTRKPSRYANTDPRWPSLRIAAKRRDGFQCVQCGSRHRLEVDHIASVQTRRDLAFDLANLQTLCARCHGAKTRFEMTGRPPNPRIDEWHDLLRRRL